MKTEKQNPLKSISKLMWLFTLVVLFACNNPKGFTQECNSRVKPKIDIHTAVITENVEALKQHIEAGTNLNEKDPFGGSSPLISAALFGKTEMAKTLIEAGADINFQNNEGSTALHTASFFCRPAIVAMLLKKGSDKAIKNKFGSTAHESVAGSFAEVKQIYEMMGKMLESMGLKLDYAYIEKTRPDIAKMLK